jgi:cation transport ATPase
LVDQCRQENAAFCLAEKNICRACPEKEAGQKRLFEADHKKRERKEKHLVFSFFVFSCSLLFFIGLPGGLLAKSIFSKIIATAIFFVITFSFSRQKLLGRIVYGGMEKPFVFTLGISLVLLSFLLFSQPQYLIPSVIFLFPGLYLYHKGFSAGPHLGWSFFFIRHNM